MKKISCIISLLLVLQACTPSFSPSLASNDAHSAALTASRVHDDHYYVDRLKNYHVKAFILGDQIMIVIPKKYLFSGQSTTLLSSGYSTLDVLSQMIGRYHSISVQVAVYADGEQSARVARSFTQEQANNIVRYLGRQGINTRLVYAVGGGNTRFVSPPQSGDCGENNRVEITLEKLPDC